MGLFGPPDIEKMKNSRDVDGLIKALRYQVERYKLDKITSPGFIRRLRTKQQFKRDVSLIRVWSQAADALAEMGDARAVEPLITSLKEVNNQAAIHALGKLGDARAVQPLGDKLNFQLAAPAYQNFDPGRVDAVWALVEIGGDQAIEQIITAINANVETVRKAAAKALVQIGASAIEPLIATLKASGEDARKVALDALAEFGWMPDSMEQKVWFWVASQQWGKCVELGKPAVDPLIAALSNQDKNARQGIVDALGKIGDARAVEPLVAALKDSDFLVRILTAEALAKIGDARSVEPLIAALGDENQSVRKKIIAALAKIKGNVQIKPLISILMDKDKGVYMAAAQALDDLGWAPVSAEDKTWYLIAKQEWGKLKALGEPAFETIYAAQKDDHEVVREKAAAAFEKILENLLLEIKDELAYTQAFPMKFIRLDKFGGATQIMWGLDKGIYPRAGEMLQFADNARRFLNTRLRPMKKYLREGGIFGIDTVQWSLNDLVDEN
jgi:HEAT repeat protein